MPTPGWLYDLVTCKTWRSLCSYKSFHILRFPSHQILAQQTQIDYMKIILGSCPATELTISSFVWKIFHDYSSRTIKADIIFSRDLHCSLQLKQPLRGVYARCHGKDPRVKVRGQMEQWNREKRSLLRPSSILL